MSPNKSEKSEPTTSGEDTDLELEDQKHPSQPPKKKKPPVRDNGKAKKAKTSQDTNSEGWGFKVLIILALLLALGAVLAIWLNL